MSKNQIIEELARKFELRDTKCYGWTDEQFDTWWTKDRRSEPCRKRQRERALIAYEYFND